MSPTWLIAALPALPLAITLWNLVSWKRPRPTSHPSGSSPNVSVLIPARNEERNLGALLDTVLDGQPEVLEVVVCDDGSTDRTAEIVHQRARAHPKLRLIEGKPLAPGWVGKPHACHQLAAAANGDCLLFVDSDVRLVPGAVGGLLTLHERRGSGRHAGVVSAVPRQLTGSFLERLILPLLHLTYTAWLPLVLVESTRSTRAVAANGQLLLVDREAYARTGGFESVKAELVDDVAFCRRAKACGVRVCFADGHHLASCRMYQGGQQVWAGFSKNVYPGIGASPWTLAFILALYLGCFVLPYGALAVGLAVLPSLVLPSAVGVAANVVLRLALAVRYRQPASGIILHPLSVLALSLIALASAAAVRRGEVQWAGRTYSGRVPRSPVRQRRTVRGRSRGFLRIARPYVRHRLQRQFESVRVAGLDEVRARAAKTPVILAANHVSWWDPLLLVALDEALGGEGYCLMDSKNLRDLPFFEWVGALPIDREHPRQAHRDLVRAAEMLTRPGQVLAIFPQGVQRPAHLELRLQRGIEVLAARAKAPVFPLAIRYDFGEGPRLRAHLSFGAPIDPGEQPHGSLSHLVEAGIRNGLERIDEVVSGRPDAAVDLGFSPLFSERATGRIPLASRALTFFAGGRS